ncbi:hypothetical protein F8388_021634 [Cannabis sativa]|uniref:Ku70/Ku80 C-terminal arm domain-containing protein n=1 Tax=Cannabis sativa TaxID=3483 RepID=A0A7J6GU39_CANSA|nr:hypothetical protein F8388_021634 [Cannabis sativa]KAF4386437.1 hypothetical protein G4B88_020257 [Cannabis sativa]
MDGGANLSISVANITKGTSMRLGHNLVAQDTKTLQLHSSVAAPSATDEQTRKAASLMKRIDLRDFSVCQFANAAELLPFGMAECAMIAFDFYEIKKNKMLQYPRIVFVAALKQHYAVLQTLALEEDEMPDIKDETVPDEEGMPR